ncbi:conserved hypothetical protein [Streptomyces viridochromogenes DSM 40736]|uniref:Lipoprotein n=1 Tax=Streptomyces viridochromogenes (strain DSM 40736 / JCM 4977 / BCRC 1201 / Tue 494) TaxID=591159 RepID=D9X4R3_STRVT|nr:hypothetical protein [Streptomyces viridochromogenes]EFL29722.1 conserved hypothetical protein [Streptomyces viridochromogenes DSM 40736]
MFRNASRPARWRAYTVGCVAALGIAAAAVPAAAASAVDGNDRYTAQEIHTFLEDFYGEHGPGNFARTYGIAPQLKEKVAANPEFDVLLCAQNIPVSIDVGPVTTAQSARVGWATVSTYWNGGEGKADFTAYVDLDATRPIQLLDVDCGFEG